MRRACIMSHALLHSGTLHSLIYALGFVLRLRTEKEDHLFTRQSRSRNCSTAFEREKRAITRCTCSRE
jgi:hypothetical protein